LLKRIFCIQDLTNWYLFVFTLIFFGVAYQAKF
jgi:hypothetical protein